MLKVLVPVDGSENSVRAADTLVKWRGRLAVPAEIHLLNVQPALHGEVGMFLKNEQMRDYHHDEGAKAIQPSREVLDAAGMDYTVHISVGDPTDVITRFAMENHCDLIVLGTHGLGRIATLLHGSVAAKVLENTDVPVVLIK